MTMIAAPFHAIAAILKNQNPVSRRAEKLGQLSQLSDLQLARMGLNRQQLIHNVSSGYHYS